jgi:hypothetical protein
MNTTLLPYAGTVANQISCVKISRITRKLHASPRHETTDSLAKFTGTVIAKGKSMKTTIRNLLAAMLLMAFSFQSHAQGTLIDQESATTPLDTQTPGVDFLNIQEDAPLVQSFIPSFSSIDFASFEFADVPNNGTAGATVEVKLYEGSPNPQAAMLLGTTAAVYMPNGFGLEISPVGLTNFYFSTPIALTAGETYYLEPVVLSGDNPWDIMGIESTYSNGQLFEDGYGFDSDLWFQEGINAVPEPTALALIGIGILAFIFRHRLKLPVLVFASILLTVPVLSVNASDVSIVAATSENAGLSPVSVSPDTVGTYWITSVNPNGGLTTLPYPFLPTDMSDLPAYFVTNFLFTPCNFF